MLSWSESDPDFKPDQELAAAFEAQTTDAEFEDKVAGLIKRAYGRDTSMRERYRSARAKLAEGDHYLLIMIDRALGWRVRAWWPF
ncbi:MAG: hypothetical protein ACRERC_05360 [Candidatus Binatia bacterium]